MQFDSQNIQNTYVFQNYKKEQSGLQDLNGNFKCLDGQLVMQFGLDQVGNCTCDAAEIVGILCEANITCGNNCKTIKVHRVWPTPIS